MSAGRRPYMEDTARQNPLPFQTHHAPTESERVQMLLSDNENPVHQGDKLCPRQLAVGIKPLDRTTGSKKAVLRPSDNRRFRPVLADI